MGRSASFLKAYCHGFKWKRARAEPKQKSADPESLVVKPMDHPREPFSNEIAVLQFHSQESPEYELPEFEFEFDPQSDYAKVLEEARSHVGKCGQGVEEADRDKENGADPWLQRSSECQLDVYRQLEVRLLRSKRPKTWRAFLFWRGHRPKPEGGLSSSQSLWMTLERDPEEEAEENTRRRSSKRSVKSMSCSAKLGAMANSSSSGGGGGGSSSGNGSGSGSSSRMRIRQSKTRSGPLYTDGLPLEPSNIRMSSRSHSGLLSCNRHSFKCGHTVPYAPLHCPPPPFQSPLYCC